MDYKAVIEIKFPRGANAVEVEFVNGSRAKVLRNDADTLNVRDLVKSAKYLSVPFKKNRAPDWDKAREVAG